MQIQKNFQKQIDLLIEMAGSEANYETLSEELADLEKEITAKKEEVKDAKKEMKDDKYIKDNDRIIDENIKIGLENKIQVYEHEKDKIMKNLTKASLDEEDTHQSLNNILNRITSLKKLLEALEEKLKHSQREPSLKTFYESMIEKANKDLEELALKKESVKKQYDKVKDTLAYFGNKRNDLEEKIKTLKAKLEDTLTALKTPNFYVDEVLKKKDEEIVDTLSQELEDLEQERLKIITDPVYIGHEAMKLYLENDLPASLAAIKELVTIVKAKPYMTEDKSKLKPLLEQAELKLEEFANIMDNNTYLGKDTKIIEERKSYIKEQLDEIAKKEKTIQTEIEKIDQETVKMISNRLNEVETLYNQLKEEYDEYKEIVFEEDDTASKRKKTTLQTAYNRKKEEMDAVYKVFQAYQSELEEAIIKSKKLEIDLLENMQAKKQQLLKEADELKIDKTVKSKTKDILAMEKDKATLKQLSDTVDAIKHAQKYSKNVLDIYQEIEKLLTKEASLEEQEETLDAKDFVNLEEFRIPNNEEEDNQEQLTEEKEPSSSPEIVNNSPEVTPSPEESLIKIDPAITEEQPLPIAEKILQTADENLEDTLVFPPRQSIEPEIERYKVISVEELPINSKKGENLDTLDASLDQPVKEDTMETLDTIPPLAEQPVSNEQTDESEYLSFNDILNGDGLNGD